MELKDCKSIYIAGPMRGLPYFNFIKFKRIEFWLKKNFFMTCIINPVNIDIERHGLDIFICSENGNLEDLEKFSFCFDFKETISKDLSHIINNCDSIFMLDGWEESSGAKLEKLAAETFNHAIFYEKDFKDEINKFYKKG